MSAPSSGDVPVPAPAPGGLPAAQELGAEQIGTAVSAEPTVKLKKGYLTLFVLAYCALFIAWIAPIGFSLAIRMGQLDPQGKDTLLAVALGIPGLAVLVTGPLIGVLSDRTRVRFGKRRTWLVAGSIAGLIGSIIVGLASSVPLVIAAWTLAYIGYTAVGAMMFTHLGDRLPEQQRGRVSGFTGAATQLAPIVGIIIAGTLTSTPALMFVIPAIVTFIGVGIFVLVMKDEPARITAPVDVKALLQGFYFNPRRHRDFAWVWLSRALVFVAISFMSIYGVYLLGARLGLTSPEIAALTATAGLGGVLVGVLGALAGGYLSDKLKRRKPFLVVGALLLAAGLLTTATLDSLPQYFVGALVSTLAIGVYGVVDNAIMLDVLPQEEGQNGRYLAIFNLANQGAQAIGPFIAALIIGLAAGEYGWIYAIAAAFALLGAITILPVRTGSKRRTSPRVAE